MGSMASYLTGSTDSEQNGQYGSSSHQCVCTRNRIERRKHSRAEGRLCPPQDLTYTPPCSVTRPQLCAVLRFRLPKLAVGEVLLGCFIIMIGGLILSTQI